MVTNFHLGLDGRLGNQLFQYAALKALCLERDYKLVLPDFTIRSWHGQNCLLHYFNIDQNFSSDFSTIEVQYEESHIDEFDKSFFDIQDSTSIRGFFQNLKYFEKYKKEIIDQLTPKSTIYEEGKRIIDSYRRDNPNYELVSLHIRRGDNITVNTEFGIKMFGTKGVKVENNGSVWGNYYSNVRKHFYGKRVKYLLFTGGNRDNNDSEDIQWLRENFSGDEFLLASTPNPLLDYSLISMCDHNVMCHATSFGWWAAYVNKNPNKTVIIPKDYFLDGSDSSRLIDYNFLSI